MLVYSIQPIAHFYLPSCSASAQQSPFSPSNAYPYTPTGDQQQRPGAYHAHSRSHSSIKQESMTPPISSVYSPDSAIQSGASYQQQAYPSSSHTPSQSQGHSHLNVSMRQTPASTPSSPMSYMHTSHSQPGQYYSPDHQAMAVDHHPPAPKRRSSGFRQVRDPRDLQPRLDIPQNNRRLDASGVYLSVSALIPWRFVPGRILRHFPYFSPCVNSPLTSSTRIERATLDLDTNLRTTRGVS